MYCNPTIFSERILTNRLSFAYNDADIIFEGVFPGLGGSQPIMDDSDSSDTNTVPLSISQFGLNDTVFTYVRYNLRL